MTQDPRLLIASSLNMNTNLQKHPRFVLKTRAGIKVRLTLDFTTKLSHIPDLSNGVCEMF